MENEKDIAPINEDFNEEIYEVEQIKQKIYFIRGKQVMLDSDVAKYYKVETKRINEAVKRNIKRFPEQFCFKLTEEELENASVQFITLNNSMRSQIATESKNSKSKKK